MSEAEETLRELMEALSRDAASETIPDEVFEQGTRLMAILWMAEQDEEVDRFTLLQCMLGALKEAAFDKGRPLTPEEDKAVVNLLTRTVASLCISGSISRELIPGSFPPDYELTLTHRGKILLANTIQRAREVAPESELAGLETPIPFEELPSAMLQEMTNDLTAIRKGMEEDKKNLSAVDKLDEHLDTVAAPPEVVQKAKEILRSLEDTAQRIAEEKLQNRPVWSALNRPEHN